MTMTSAETLGIIVEFARAEQAGDPFAFRFAPQQYLLRSAGGGFEEAALDWNEALLADLQGLRMPGGDPEIPARIGAALRRFLASTSWSEQEAQLLEAAKAGRRVILTVRSAAAELYALPWELLTIKSTGQHIGELPEVLIRYEWPDTTTLESAQPASSGRVLVAWSAAGGAVPAAEHIRAIESACRAGSHPFDPERDVLANASCGRLSAALGQARSAEQPVAILHLLCHGGELGSTFGLSLDGEQPGDGRTGVDAGRLRQILAPHAASLRLVVLSACDSGNSGALGNHLGSLAQALHRAGIAQVVASRYPLSARGSAQLATRFYEQLLAGPSSTETAFLAARALLAEDAEHRDWASLQLYARPADGDDGRPLVVRPFRGLLAFQPTHHRLFFGREREIAETIKDLAALSAAGKPRLLVVAGSSGSGKSSVVLAGAVPRLLEKANGGFRFQYLRLTSDPNAALDSALKSETAEPEAPLLLVVDQFEELFTHVKDAAARQSFVNRLFRLASAEPPRVHVLLTLRVDFLGRCGEIFIESAGVRFDRIAYDEAHRVFIAQMGRKEIQAAIEEPLRRVGMQLEAGLLSRILDDVGAEPGALPLLQHTLDILWQRRSGRLLRQKDYEEIGGVAGALKGRADALIDACSEPEQHVARRLLVRLVNMKIDQDAALATRQRVARSALRPTEAASAACFDRVLASMVEARLLVLGGEGAEQHVEVAHEALIRKWPRLQAWLRADLARRAAIEELEAWAKQWRAHGTVLLGEQLAYADSVARRLAEDLGSEVRQMLAASRKRMRSRRRSAWVVLFFGFVPILCYLAAWYYDYGSKHSLDDLLGYVFFTSGFIGFVFGPFLVLGFLALALWRVVKLSLGRKGHHRRDAAPDVWSDRPASPDI